MKSPKLYLRDTGLLHSLLAIPDGEALLAHPIVGASWEGLVVENLLSAAPEGSDFYFYRTVVGAEVDLVLVLPGGDVWAVEIKRSLSPALSKGFHLGRADIGASRGFCVYAGKERYPLGENIEAISLPALREELGKLRS